MNQTTIKNILIGISIISIIIISSRTSYNYGYKLGGKRGVIIAFDTVFNIMEKQINGDSNTYTKVIYNDSNIYRLSHKTVIVE